MDNNQNCEPPFASSEQNNPEYTQPNYTDYYKNHFDTRSGSDEVKEVATGGKGAMLVFLAWGLCMLCVEVFAFGGMGLSIPISAAALYAVSAWFFPERGIRVPKTSLFLLIPIALLAASFIFIDSTMSNVITLLVLVTFIPVQLAYMNGYDKEPPFSAGMVGDILKWTFLKPFQFFDMPFHALAGTNKNDTKNNTAVKVLLGILVSIPVAWIFLALFSSADEIFKEFLHDIIEKSGIDFSHVLIDAILGAVIAIYVAAWFIALKGMKNTALREKSKSKGLDTVILSSFLGTINVVQILFVIIQLRYFFNNEQRSKSDVTRYARSGFFELCWAAAIAAVIIGLTIILCRKKDDGKLPLPVSISITVLILCNYIIFASAINRMILYIADQDMTLKRLLTMWLMVLFALCFAGALLRVWLKKFRIFPWVAVCVVGMTLALNLANIDQRVAEYNVNQYLNSKKDGEYTKTLDFSIFYTLEASAAPHVAKLIDENTQYSSNAQRLIEYYYRGISKKTWRNYTVNDALTKSTLEKYCTKNQ